MNFASMLLGTTQLPSCPVTRSVRLSHLPVRPDHALLRDAAVTKEDKRREQLAKAREIAQKKIEVANGQPAVCYASRGRYTKTVYDYMTSAYPNWVTSADIAKDTKVNPNTVSLILFNMNSRGHLDKKKVDEKSRFKLYRLVVQ